MYYSNYQQKPATYARMEPSGFPFVPFFLETYGLLGQLVMKLLLSLGDEAAGPGGGRSGILCCRCFVRA
jgi:hypothetical protein